jgi:peroxiredoxin
MVALLLVLAAVPAADSAARPAPGFVLPLFSGRTLTLADLAGTPAILFFWAPWCPTCNHDAPGWERVYERWGGRGIRFVGIGLLDSRDACVEFVRRYRLTFPNGYDADGRIAHAYGFTVQPYWAVISKNGMLLRAEYGPSSEALLVSVVRSLGSRDEYSLTPVRPLSPDVAGAVGTWAMDRMDDSGRSVR